MITNASLISIGTPGVPTLGGDPGELTTQVIGKRCRVEPIGGQSITLSARTAGATATVYVSKSMAPGLVISPRQQLTLQIDGDGSSSTLEVIESRNQQGGISHWQCFVKDLG